MDLLHPAVLALTVVAATIMFGVAAYFTRATPRRIVGALLAALPLVPLIMLYDALASRLGWWYYPTVPDGRAPLAWYVAAALSYGAALGLVGWRVIRRSGRRGLAAYLVLFALFGLTRDCFYSITSGLIIFGEGPVPLIADYLAYASGAGLVQLLMYWIVGRPQSDLLARARRT